MSSSEARSQLLEAAWSPDEMLRFFNERVLPELYPGRRLERARPKRMAHQPGRSREVLYELSARAGDGPAIPPLAVVSFSDGEDLIGSAARRYGPLEANRLAGPGRAMLLPGLGALVEFFPMDWRIPALGAAADVERMAPLLDALAGSDAATESGGCWSCTPLRYHPRTRCVLLYERAGVPMRRVVGKVFAKPKRVREAWAKLTSLAEAGEGSRRWRSPRPLHRDEHLVLMEWMAGEPMKDVLERGADSETSSRLVRLAAGALAELHRPAGRDLELRTVAIDRAKLARRAERVAALDAEMARRVGELLDRVTEHWRGLSPPATTLIHGSASPNQLLVDGNRLSIVDLDGVRWGDPAIDVGTFMASLWKYCDPARASRPEALPERFLEEYRAHHPTDPELARRARLVQCQELVNFAARSLLKRGSRPGEASLAEKPQRFLERAAACLAAL